MMATKSTATQTTIPTTTTTASSVSAPPAKATTPTTPTTPPPAAGVQRTTRANDNPKMVAAGHKAAAKAKQTERASFALMYAFKFGGGADGLSKAFKGIEKEEWAALAVARAVREAESAKEVDAHKALSALLATVKPKGGAGVGPAVPADPTRAVTKTSKRGSVYAIVRFPDGCTLPEGTELAVSHGAGGALSLAPKK